MAALSDLFPLQVNIGEKPSQVGDNTALQPKGEPPFDFQPWDTLELAPITGDERRSAGTSEESRDARKSTAGANF